MTDAMDNNPEPNLDRWAEQAGPPQLKAGLADLFGSAPAVSRFTDEKILAAARQESIGRNRRRWMIRYAIGSIAAAAAVILIAIKTTHREQRMASSPSAAVASAEDVNRDGKLDILDAYFMARKVADNQPLAKEWDFNNDGAIDNRDVDVVAFSAVKIKGGENP